MQGMIDIHQHIVYGLDDGASSRETSQKMLHEAVAQGITRIIATPHAEPGLKPFPYEAYVERLNELNEYAYTQRLPIRLEPGCEILYTPFALRELDAGKLPTLSMTEAVLVEFGVKLPYDELFDGVRKLANGGYLPVIAHVERYECLVKQPQRISELKRLLHAKVQVNAQSLLRHSGLHISRFCHRLLEEEMVDLIASDAHGTQHRPICLGECREQLLKRYDPELVDEWLGQNQRALFPRMR